MTNKSKIIAILFSEFVKMGISKGFDDFHIARNNNSIILQSWHKESSLTDICVIEEKDICEIRAPAAYILENTRTSKSNGN